MLLVSHVRMQECSKVVINSSSLQVISHCVLHLLIQLAAHKNKLSRYASEEEKCDRLTLLIKKLINGKQGKNNPAIIIGNYVLIWFVPTLQRMEAIMWNPFTPCNWDEKRIGHNETSIHRSLLYDA
jgi:hypothetical protein